MIKKIDKKQKFGNTHISILYPGFAINGIDSGLGSIGRIDQANIKAGTTIKMHPHINDDILSYFRIGKVKHTDSQGFTEYISRNKLMLMKAGTLFYHEESIVENLEGLQIFIRPKEADTTPKVSFCELEEADSINQWRLIAAPSANAPLFFSSQTWMYDMSLDGGIQQSNPEPPKSKITGILYVFQGDLTINDEIKLLKGECVIFKDEEKPLNFKTNDSAELVLFLTDENGQYSEQGMFSGNQVKI